MRVIFMRLNPGEKIMEYTKSVEDLREEEEEMESEIDRNAMGLLSYYPEVKKVNTVRESPMYTRQ